MMPVDYVSPYKTFVFESYDFNPSDYSLTLRYNFDDSRLFVEKVVFDVQSGAYDAEVLDALCFYVFIVAGTSYYKTFVAPTFELRQGSLTQNQADFFNMLYRGGLSQFIYENKLNPDILAEFKVMPEFSALTHPYEGNGLLVMQSGGKDSLLAAELLKNAGHDFISWHMSTTGKYPEVLDSIGMPISVAQRTIDLPAIQKARQEGGLNGHIPFSALFAGYALIGAVLKNKATVIAANESSSDEVNVVIDGYEVNHQFSKTYAVELALQDYLHSNVSPDIHYGSILRPFSELKIGELFANRAWPKYKDLFSSCNLGNYKQGEDDGKLKWDGTCPKCANSFLLFAPFVGKQELLGLFGGKNLLQSPDMLETYKQLLDLSDIKPFECVGTYAEMQTAYHMAHAKDPDYTLPGDIAVPQPEYDYTQLHAHQALFDELIDYSTL